MDIEDLRLQLECESRNRLGQACLDLINNHVVDEARLISILPFIGEFFDEGQSEDKFKMILKKHYLGHRMRVPVIIKDHGKAFCPLCSKDIHGIGRVNYCPNCGQPVKWG